MSDWDEKEPEITATRNIGGPRSGFVDYEYGGWSIGIKRRYDNITVEVNSLGDVDDTTDLATLLSKIIETESGQP